MVRSWRRARISALVHILTVQFSAIKIGCIGGAVGACCLRRLPQPGLYMPPIHCLHLCHQEVTCRDHSIADSAKVFDISMQLRKGEIGYMLVKASSQWTPEALTVGAYRRVLVLALGSDLVLDHIGIGSQRAQALVTREEWGKRDASPLWVAEAGLSMLPGWNSTTRLLSRILSSSLMFHPSQSTSTAFSTSFRCFGEPIHAKHPQSKISYLASSHIHLSLLLSIRDSTDA